MPSLCSYPCVRKSTRSCTTRPPISGTTYKRLLRASRTPHLFIHKKNLQTLAPGKSHAPFMYLHANSQPQSRTHPIFFNFTHLHANSLPQSLTHLLARSPIYASARAHSTNGLNSRFSHLVRLMPSNVCFGGGGGGGYVGVTQA